MNSNNLEKFVDGLTLFTPMGIGIDESKMDINDHLKRALLGPNRTESAYAVAGAITPYIVFGTAAISGIYYLMN